jgi:DNA-binding MarR family transcriptional regulator
MGATPGLKEMTEATLLASRAMLAVVARSLAGALEDVTLPQFRAMVILDTQGPQRTGAVADLVGVHQSTFTRTADRLVRDGWVLRVENPDSRREVLLELTDRGRELVAVVMTRRQSELRRALTKVPVGQRAAVVEGMRAFAAAAGEPDAADLLTLGL